jgi:SAM-dependent methyltransferase
MLKAIKKRITFSSRNRKLDHFYSLFPEGMSVLDAGVSSENIAEPLASNQFLKTFKYAPRYYTGLGVDDLSRMNELYPGKRFVEYPGGQFPFRDKEFDWVFSNAVIEHVGDDDAQLYFLNEMLRVGKSVFFTTPNKFFPVETHTDVLFLHYNNDLFHRWCRQRHPWVSKYDPYLFSYSRLEKMLNHSRAARYRIYPNRLLGWTMTFTTVCSENADGSF